MPKENFSHFSLPSIEMLFGMRWRSVLSMHSSHSFLKKRRIDGFLRRVGITLIRWNVLPLRLADEYLRLHMLIVYKSIYEDDAP